MSVFTPPIWPKMLMVYFIPAWHRSGLQGRGGLEVGGTAGMKGKGFYLKSVCVGFSGNSNVLRHGKATDQQFQTALNKRQK